MFEQILNLIYPPSCGICGKFSKNNLCKKCELKLKDHELSEKQSYRKLKGKHFDSFFSLFKYEGIIREKIIEYKFEDKPYLYKLFSKIISKKVKIFGLLESGYDIIIPVPIHKKKKWLRGYNQTELISKEISKDMNIEYQNNMLVKIKNTESQSSLSKKDRKSNIKDVFGLNYKCIEKIKNKKIILFDDIYTTGSTVNECSKVLKKYGVGEILVLTIAKD